MTNAVALRPNNSLREMLTKALEEEPRLSGGVFLWMDEEGTAGWMVHMDNLSDLCSLKCLLDLRIDEVLRGERAVGDR